MLQQYRRRRAARSEHDCLRLDPEAVTTPLRGTVRERRNDLAGDTRHTPATATNFLNLYGSKNACASAKRCRHITHVHALLGAATASGETLAASSTAFYVSGDRLARHTHLVAAVAKEQVTWALNFLGRRRNPQKIRNRIKMRV